MASRARAENVHEEKKGTSAYLIPKWVVWLTMILLVVLLVLAITLPLTLNKNKDKNDNTEDVETCPVPYQLIPNHDPFMIDPFDELDLLQSDRNLGAVARGDKLRSIWENLTFDQKLGQLSQWARGDINVPQEPGGVYAKWIPMIQNGAIGSILNVVNLKLMNYYQQTAKDAGQLPLLFGFDVIHGYSTIFPINIGMAAAFDRQMIYDYATIAAKEQLNEGIPWTFAPMLDVSRDPRWGRMAESSGEDPYLTAELGVEYVKGFQDNGVAACVKHLVGYGAPQGGREYNTVDLSDVTLFNDYYPGYKKAMEAGAWSGMAAYNTIKGMPAHSNRELLNDMIRGLWKFGGMIVSDYAGITIMTNHRVAKDGAAAAILGLTAGVDMAMGDNAYDAGLKNYTSEDGNSWDDLLDDGHSLREHVELAAKRVLVLKERIGLFDNDGIYPDDGYAEGFRRPEYLDKAQEAAEKSAVLLKNDKKTLPMSRDHKVLLVGMLADSSVDQLGFWSGMGTNQSTETKTDTPDVITPYQAFVELFPDSKDQTQPDPSKLVYKKGYTGTTWTSTLEEDDKIAMKEALDAVDKTFDYIVYYAGESRGQNGEGSSRTDLTLSFNQSPLLRQIKAKLEGIKKADGKEIKLVLVTQTARPSILSWEDRNCDAILQMWAPGSRGGRALVRLLYGDKSPSGKLPVTYPRNVGQIPIFYSDLYVGKPYIPGPQGDDGETYEASDPFRAIVKSDRLVSRYIDSQVSPLYPFGYGLSYTTFSYSEATLAPDTASATGNETLTIKVTVTNETPSIAADEIVQVYVKTRVSKLAPHKRRLRQFQRVSFEEDQGPQVITFQLSVQEDFGYFNNSLTWVVEPGEYDILVAKHSSDESAPLIMTLN